MLDVKITLHRGGMSGPQKDLGTAVIINDLSSAGPETGNYEILLYDGKKLWKRCKVKDFPRQKLKAWDLLYRALKEMVGDRNK
jgi:hypothetical protein